MYDKEDEDVKSIKLFCCLNWSKLKSLVINEFMLLDEDEADVEADELVVNAWLDEEEDAEWVERDDCDWILAKMCLGDSALDVELLVVVDDMVEINELDDFSYIGPPVFVVWLLLVLRFVGPVIKRSIISSILYDWFLCSSLRSFFNAFKNSRPLMSWMFLIADSF